MKVTRVWWGHMKGTNRAKTSMPSYIMARTHSSLASYGASWVVVTIARTTMKKDLKRL